MMAAWTVVPATWQALVNSIGQRMPWIQEALQADLQRFMASRIDSGLLISAWQHSLLGYNGSPLEFSLSSAKPEALAATFDPLLPEPQAARSMSAFARHYTDWAGTSPESQHCFHQVAQWQHSALPLRFGSWLGRKYSAQAQQTKVYSELPAGWGFPAETSLCGYRGLSALMVGYYPDQPDSPQEYYLLWHQAEIDLPTIMDVMQHFGANLPMREGMATLLQQALEMEQPDFPATTYGFSLVVHRRQLVSITLFTMAPGFCGSNANVSAWLQAFQQRSELRLPLLDTLIQAKIPLQFNVLGFSVEKQGNPALNCTFSPQSGRFITRQVSSKKTAVERREITALLRQSQASSGAFLSEVLTPDGQWHQDENGFVTAQVLRTLEYTPEMASSIERALDFLERCETTPYRFSFWPRDAHPPWMRTERITPDVDDTALITEVLYRFGRRTPLHLQQAILAINNYQVTKVDPRLKPLQHKWAQVRALLTWMRDDQPIDQLDCCVNTNALILMHCFMQTGGNQFPAYAQILKMLARAIAWAGEDYDRLNQLTPYYAHPHEWLVTLQYAQQCGITEMSPLVDALAHWQPPATRLALPLYRRHDGKYLWTSRHLAGFRQLSEHHHCKEHYERLSY